MEGNKTKKMSKKVEMFRVLFINNFYNGFNRVVSRDQTYNFILIL